MATEKRLIDANKLSEAIEETAGGLADCDQQNAAWALRKYAIRDITDAPTVDAVEVVRCKDCKLAYINSYSKVQEKALCSKWRNHDGNMALMNADDFCTYGERRTDNA